MNLERTFISILAHEIQGTDAKKFIQPKVIQRKWQLRVVQHKKGNTSCRNLNCEEIKCNYLRSRK